eukprot:UN26792
MVKILLTHKEIDVNKGRVLHKLITKQTPNMMDVKIFKLILAHPTVDLNINSKTEIYGDVRYVKNVLNLGLSSQYGMSYCRFQMIQMLMHNKQHEKHVSGRDLFHVFSWDKPNRYGAKIVNMLLDRKNIDINAEHPLDKSTPLLKVLKGGKCFSV